MTEVSPLMHHAAGRSVRQILDNAKREGELSAVLVEQLRQAPTLRKATRNWLVHWLRDHMQFPNPDGVFIHRKNAEGARLEPLSLTEFSLHALWGDRTYIDNNETVVSSRRGEVESQYGIPGLDLEAVKAMFSNVLPKIGPSFKLMLDDYWTADEQTFNQIPGENAVTGTREQILAVVQRRVFYHSIAFAAHARGLDEQDQSRLYRVVDDESRSGCHALSFRTPDGLSMPLNGSFVADAQGMDILQGGLNGIVYLYTPAWGIEKFETRALMETALQQRLEQEDSRDALLGCLSLEHQVVAAQSSVDTLRPDYQALRDTPAGQFIVGLRQKQLDDVEYLLSTALSGDNDLAQRLQMFDDACQADDLVHALNSRYLDILAFVRERSMPHWLKYADAGDRQRHEQLAAENVRYQALVKEHLAGVESLEIFARQEIATYLMDHLGYTLDPEKVSVKLPDEFQVGEQSLKPIYKHSLLHFAMEGIPDVDQAHGPGIEVDPAYAHVRFDYDFVSRLVEALDLKLRYGQEVERRYRTQAMRNALEALRISDIALSAWSAKMQGHLSDHDMKMIDRIQASSGHDDKLHVGALYLTGSSRRLEDVIVLREVNDQDEHYILYVPGLPGSREMFSFDSWRKLALEVGGWTANAQTAQYLLDQAAVTMSRELVPFIESIRLKPTNWSSDSVRFVTISGSSFSETMARFVDYKNEQIFNRNDFVSGARMQHVTAQHRSAQVTLGYRIAAVNTAYNNYGITPWRDAARHECKRLIDQHFKASGVPGQIDPDTVFCDLDGRATEGEPDFGRYTALKSLTDLFMAGYSDEEYEFHPQAVLYSSVGQDLSALSAEFIDQMIRGSNFADEYVIQLRKHMWGLTNSAPRQAKALYGRKKNYEMRRDALIEFQRRHISLDQYNWLVRMITGLDGSGGSVSSTLPGTFHALAMERKSILDVFIFKPDNMNAHLPVLAYTPDAPDGYLFRPQEDIVSSVPRPGMAQYFYDRATYKAQRIIGTLMAQLEHSPVIDGKHYVVTHSPVITDLRHLHEAMVQHLVIDIDSQTESVNERRVLRTYNFVRKYGGYIARLNPLSAAIWHAIHAGVDLFRGIYAYQDGDRARARDFYISAAKEAFKTAKNVRKIRKKEKLRQLKKETEASTSRPAALAYG